VVVAVGDGTAWAEVVDDGVGFDVGAARTAAAGGHVGLLGITDLVDPVPTIPARLVYRVVQEALRNVVAHAAATTVTVRASSTTTTVSAEVVDDGRGFDPAAARSADDGHLGLTGLAALTADAGGTLLVDSAPGRGTTIRVEASLDPMEVRR
jgi:signal transduction histidine kinase